MKFIQFRIGIPDRKEDFLTEAFVKKIHEDNETRSGIYKLGYVEIGVLEKDDTLAVCGKYYAPTVTECKAMLKILKEEIKREFQMKKTIDLMVGWGNKLS